MKHKILFSLLITAILINIQSAKAQIGGYLFPHSKLDKFAPSIYTGAEKDNISVWIKDAEVLKDGWRPSGERYVVYRVKTLTYWFGPYNDNTAHQQALNRLYQLREKLPAEEEFIFVYPVTVTAGKAVTFQHTLVQGGAPVHIPPATDVKNLNAEHQKVKSAIQKLQQIKVENLPENIPGMKDEMKKLDDVAKAMGDVALDAKSAETLEKLKGKHDKGTSQKDGMKGSIKVSYPFPKWFSLTVNILMEYFFPKLKGIMEKALTLAYMIMPDVVDRIASTLARLQDKITPDKLDDALNEIANIVEYAYNIYNDLSRLQNLLSDPDFQGLLNDIDLTDVVKGLKGLEKIDNITGGKLKIPKVTQYIPVGCLNSTESNCLEEIKKITKNKIREEVFRQTDKYIKKSGIPVLKDLNIGAFNNLIDDKDLDKFARKQAQSLVCPHVPASYKGSCTEFIDGKYEKAAKSAVNTTIEKYSKLNPANINEMMRALEKEDYVEALRQAAKSSKTYYKKHFGPYWDSVDAIIDIRDQKDAKKVMDVFIRSTVDNEMIINAIDGGAFIIDRIIKGEEIEIKKELETILERELKNRGYDLESIKRILKGEYKLETQNMLKMIAQEMGITSPEAIEAIKNGNFELAMDKQIEFLQNQNLGEKGQVGLLKENFQSKQRMLELSQKLVNGNNREKKFFQQSIKQ